MSRILGRNNTLICYKDHTLKSPYLGTCMSFTSRLEEDAKIIIPFCEKLNKGVTETTINDWVGLGNKLIFPAEVTKGNCNYDIINGDDLLYYNIIQDYIDEVIVRPKQVKPNNGRYYASDAWNVGTAYLINIRKDSLTLGNRSKWGLLNTITHNNNNPWDTTWNIDLRDFESVETGECLWELVKRLYDKHKDAEKEENTKDKDNSYIITVKYTEGVSNTHRLAMTMFYRYLYSSLYNGIVYHTLEAIKQGVNPWDALMLAHRFVMPKYDSYYGLLFKYPTDWYSMGESLSNLKSFGSVNTALTKSWSTGDSLVMIGASEPGIEIDYNRLVYPTTDESLMCIFPSKTLIKDKRYHILGEDNDKVLVTCEDFANRWVSLKRFKY